VAGVRIQKSKAVAVGILCAVAATVAVWSGPLFAASSALHAASRPLTHTVGNSQTAR
jgi:hypothetical protein